MSPVRWPSKVTKAVASSNGLALIKETQVLAGRSGTLADTRFQLPPPSRVMWSRPSSEPTHTTLGFFGDSLMA